MSTEADRSFGTWDAAGELLGFSLLAYVGLVLVCFMWDMVVNRVSRLAKVSPRMAMLRISFHPKNAAGRTQLMLHFAMGMVQMCLYSWRTAQFRDNLASDVIGTACGVYFVLDLALTLVLANPRKRRTVALTAYQFCNILAIFSSLWTPFTRPRQIFSLGFLRVLTMYKVYTTLVYHYLRDVLSDVHQKVLNLAVGTLTLFLFFASLIMTLENMGDTTFFAFLSPEDSARWNMFTSFYFIMVTISTVGYGDMSAGTVLGRITVIIMIVVGILMFTVQTTDLMELMEGENTGTGRYIHNSKDQFILVCGDLSLQTLKELLQELFHPDHGESRDNLKVVVLVDKTYEVDNREWLHRDPIFKNKVRYLRGEVFTERDLDRVCASQAVACFMVCDKWSRDDTKNVLRVLAFKRFVPGVPVYCMLCQKENQKLLEAAGVSPHQIMCIDSLTMGLIGQNIVTPGVSTLLMNLAASLDHSLPEVAKKKRKRRKKKRGFFSRAKASTPRVQLAQSDNEWLREYQDGAAQEIYEVEVPQKLIGLTMRQVQQMVYSYSMEGDGVDDDRFRSGVVVIGLASADSIATHNGLDQLEKIITNSTVDRPLRTGDVLLCVADDHKSATEAVRLHPISHAEHSKLADSHAKLADLRRARNAKAQTTTHVTRAADLEDKVAMSDSDSDGHLSDLEEQDEQLHDPEASHLGGTALMASGMSQITDALPRPGSPSTSSTPRGSTGTGRDLPRSRGFVVHNDDDDDADGGDDGDDAAAQVDENDDDDGGNGDRDGSVNTASAVRAGSTTRSDDTQHVVLGQGEDGTGNDTDNDGGQQGGTGDHSPDAEGDDGGSVAGRSVSSEPGRNFHSGGSVSGHSVATAPVSRRNRRAINSTGMHSSTASPKRLASMSARRASTGSAGVRSGVVPAKRNMLSDLAGGESKGHPMPPPLPPSSVGYASSVGSRRRRSGRRTASKRHLSVMTTSRGSGVTATRGDEDALKTQFYDTCALYREVAPAVDMYREIMAVQNMDAVVKKVPRDLAGHIVVTGSAWINSVHLLLRGLSTSIDPRVSVVFVTPQWRDIDAKRIHHAAAKDRREIYVVRDHPHKLHSLIKARVGHARTVLILREDPPETPVDEADFFFVDKLAIFTSMLVHTNFGGDRSHMGMNRLTTLTEFHNKGNLQFLRHTKDIVIADLIALMEKERARAEEETSDAGTAISTAEAQQAQYRLKQLQDIVSDSQTARQPLEAEDAVTRKFASGRLITSSFVTALLAQGYFKPTIVKLMSDLAGGRHKCIRQMKVTEMLCSRHYGVECEHCTELRPCPPTNFRNRQYSELVAYCFQQLHLTPIGLYRTDPVDGFRYVACNPPRHTTLRGSDLVYLFSRV